MRIQQRGPGRLALLTARRGPWGRRETSPLWQRALPKRSVRLFALHKGDGGAGSLVTMETEDAPWTPGDGGAWGGGGEEPAFRLLWHPCESVSTQSRPRSACGLSMQVVREAGPD